MRRPLGALFVAAVLSAPAACASDTTTGEPTPTEDEHFEPQPDRDSRGVAKGFEGAAAISYDVAFEICSTMTPTKIRDELGASSLESSALAEAYAQGSAGRARQGSFEGCLDGLTAQRGTP